jgi:hypothetical protein
MLRRLEWPCTPGGGELVTIGDAWREVRKDPEWLKKALIVALVGLIPAVGTLVVLGYYLVYFRQAAWGMDRGLPEWKDYPDLALKGLSAFAVTFVWSLPLTAVMVVAEMAGISYLTMRSTLAGVEPQPSSAMALGMAAGFLMVLCTYLYVPVTQSALIEFALFDRLEAGLGFRAVLRRMRENTRALTATSIRAVAVSLVAAVPMLAGMALMFGAFAEGSPTLLAVAGLTYAGGALVTVLCAPIAQLIFHRLFAEYAKQAYGLPPAPPARAA